jgi:hypothetical protein
MCTTPAEMSYLVVMSVILAVAGSGLGWMYTRGKKHEQQPVS